MSDPEINKERGITFKQWHTDTSIAWEDLGVVFHDGKLFERRRVHGDAMGISWEEERVLEARLALKVDRTAGAIYFEPGEWERVEQ